MEKKKCGFCGLEYEINKLIEGNTTYACKDCIDAMCEDKSFEEYNNNKEMVAFKPHLIKSELDKYVIGQDKAKKKIAVEVCNHYKRIAFKSFCK